MRHFQLYNPVRILFGVNQIANIGRYIPSGVKVLVTYGGGSIKQNGVYDQVRDALKGFEWTEFGGIEPNPKYETLMKAVEIVRRENIGFLLAVGGGSVMDGTKFIAAASCFEGEDPYTICTEGAEVKKAVPLGCVATLPATGSEMNNGAVISRLETKEKFAFHSPLVFPRFSVLDPTVTLSLPPRQRANGVVDAFIHVTEQYLTYPADAKVQDRFSEGLLLTLIEEGPDYVNRPDDIDTASNVVWAATMALNGLIAAGVPEDWATHQIGHEITALEGLDHAQTLALVWPGLQKVMRASKREKLLQFAERVWNLREGDEDKRIDEAIARTEAFFRSLGVGTRIADYPQMSAGFIDVIVERFRQRGSHLGERAEIDADTVRRILEDRK